MASEANCPLCGQLAVREPTAGDATFFQYKRCGRFKISGLLARMVGQSPLKEKRWVLSSATRLASDRGAALTLTTDNVDGLIESAPVPRALPELLDRLLLYVVDHSGSLLGGVQLRSDDFPIYYVQDVAELGTALSWLRAQGYVELANNLWVSATPTGWARAEELRRVTPTGTQAFVAMWFDDSTTAAYEQGIAPALRRCGYVPVRIDLVQHNEKIDDRIVAEIRRSSLLVGDFTGSRGGVYFEVGYAMGRHIPVIWTCRKDWIDRVHFDTRQYNHITWDDPATLATALEARISATLPTFPPIA